MRAMTDLLKPRAAALAGSVALGLGLLALGILGLVALGLVLPAGSALADKNDDDWDGGASRDRVEGKAFHWEGRLARGKTLEVHGINGGIEVDLASGTQAAVDARKSARKSDPESVEIEAIERADGILICARYPGPGGRLNDCEGDHQEVRNNDVVVRFKVHVPAGVRVVLRTVNGGITVTDVKGDVEATTVNGGVRVSTTGHATATTVNGSVNARIGSDLDDDLEFTTVNGRVVVEMPRSVNAEVRGSTVHGSVYSDFPLRVRGRRWGTRHIDGTLGRGGHDLVLTTVNGSIELRTLDGSRRRAVVDDDDDDEGDEDESQ